MKKLAAFAAFCLMYAWLSPGAALAQDEEPPAEEEADLEEEAAPEEEETAPAEGSPATPEVADGELYCSDGVDDDEDGDVDCEDYDCLEDAACEEGAAGGGGGEPATPPGLGLGDAPEGEEGAEEEDELLDVAEDEESGDEWEDRPLDMFELHGYLRVRADLFHMLHMHHASAAYYDEVRPYPMRPIGNVEVDCGDTEACSFANNTFAGANMRFRLEPIINLGDQVRILSQIDLLDNLVLGSTPEGYYFEPSGAGGHSPWVPLRFFSTTQVAPSDRNSLTNAVSVRRVWAEVTTPFGQLHFGRMGNHWGLGMLANQGNELDDDYGDTVDRIMLATRLWGILFVPGVDFVGQGPTTALWGDDQGQPMDAGQLDDVAQYFLVVARQLPRQEQEERIRRGDLVVNGGLYLTFRNQVLSEETVGVWSEEGGAPEPSLTLRNAWALIPDLWFQLYYRGFHLEAEFSYVGGEIENPSADSYEQAVRRGEDVNTEIRQFGGVIRGDYTALGGQLNVGLELGYASGDAELEGLTPRQSHTDLRQRAGYDGSSVDSLFRFDPDYHVDLILFRQILGQVSGAYYARPWVSYEFIRNTIGIRADVIYSLASEPLQTIGNDPNLGVEIDAAVWYRAPAPHNFVAMLQYGVLFPLGAWEDPFSSEWDRIDYPQTVQAMLAVPY